MNAHNRVKAAVRPALSPDCELVIAEYDPISDEDRTYTAWIGGVAYVLVEGYHRRDLPPGDPAYGGSGLRTHGHATPEDAWEAMYAMLQRITLCHVPGLPPSRWDPAKECLSPEPGTRVA